MEKKEIFRYRSQEGMRVVNRKLEKCGIHLVHSVEGGVHIWSNDGPMDENTREAIEQIIKGLMHIYGKN
jgi:hypothetical protein